MFKVDGHLPKVREHTPKVGGHASKVGEHTSKVGGHLPKVGEHIGKVDEHTPKVDSRLLKKIKNGNELLKTDLKNLLLLADKLAKVKPPSVINNTTAPVGIDLHDYVS